MTIGVLGCGYVGSAVCHTLIELGHEVIAIDQTDEALQRVGELGASTMRADVTDSGSLAAVPSVDVLLFAASSGGGDVDVARHVFLEGLETVISHFESRPDPPGRLVYTSSTGVYGDHDGEWVDESTPIEPVTPKAEVLAHAEAVVQDAGDMDGIVARLAGVYGPNRWGMERYLDRPVTAGYKNHAHRDDVAGVLVHLLTRGADGHEVVLVVDDEPVDRWRFATWLAAQLGVEAPPRVTIADRLAESDLPARTRRRLTTQKRCRNDRLAQLGYTFQYPTYRRGYREAIETARLTGEHNA